MIYEVIMNVETTVVFTVYANSEQEAIDYVKDTNPHAS